MKEEGKRARSADSYTFFFSLQFLCLDSLGSQWDQWSPTAHKLPLLAAGCTALIHVTSAMTRDCRVAAIASVQSHSLYTGWPWWLLRPKMGSRHETNSSAVRKRIENRMFQYQDSICS